VGRGGFQNGGLAAASEYRRCDAHLRHVVVWPVHAAGRPDGRRTVGHAEYPARFSTGIVQALAPYSVRRTLGEYAPIAAKQAKPPRRASEAEAPKLPGELYIVGEWFRQRYQHNAL
jgi:hypothetical protein